jgi:hypothetical protein
MVETAVRLPVGASRADACTTDPDEHAFGSRGDTGSSAKPP